MDNSRYIEMTTRPVPGLILSLAAPTILSMLVTSFYNLGDTSAPRRPRPSAFRSQ